MPVSYRTPTRLSCPACQTAFVAEAWLLLDVHEEPEAAAELDTGKLDRVTCPHCATSFAVAAPLLVHAGALRLVVFAPAATTPPHLWQAEARDVYALLEGSIPLEQRQPYLTDVRIAQDRAGIAHCLRKATRRQAAAPASPVPPASPPPPTRHSEPAPSAAAPPMPDEAFSAALEALMLANTFAEVQAVVQAHPLLRTPQTGDMLEQLADLAVEQRQPDVAEGLHEARMVLARVRAGAPDLPPDLPPDPPPDPVAVAPAPAAASTPVLTPELYRALLDVPNLAALQTLVANHPHLLAPMVDEQLARRVDDLLDEGHERLAHTVLTLREHLAALRTAPAAAPDSQRGDAPAPPSALETAVEALLTASSDAELAQLLATHPLLLTDDAEAALWQVASLARNEGDRDLAAHAEECRALLRQVRAGLADERAVPDTR